MFSGKDVKKSSETRYSSILILYQCKLSFSSNCYLLCNFVRFFTLVAPRYFGCFP